MITKKLFLISLCLLITTESLAASSSFWKHLRMRARESYEVVNLKQANNSTSYKGLTNTFNLFYEKPFQYSFGLAGGSIFSNLKTSDTPAAGFSDETRISFIGVEAKIFPFKKLKGFFTRPGLYWKTMNTQGSLGKIDGFTGAIGLGYEIPIYKKVTLAPELGTQFGELSTYSITGLSFSIGLHFYNI